MPNPHSCALLSKITFEKRLKETCFTFPFQMCKQNKPNVSFSIKCSIRCGRRRVGSGHHDRSVDLLVGYTYIYVVLFCWNIQGAIVALVHVLEEQLLQLIDLGVKHQTCRVLALAHGQPGMNRRLPFYVWLGSKNPSMHVEQSLFICRKKRFWG